MKEDLKVTQLKLLNKHKVLFEFIVNVANQIIRQSQLSDILIATKYCTNNTAVTRLLQKLEQAELVKRDREENNIYKYVQVTKTAVRFVTGEKAITPKTAGDIRAVRNAMKIEVLKHYFLKENMSLAELSNSVTVKEMSNLFNKRDTFYRALRGNDLAFHSFNNKSSNLFFHQKERNDLSEYRRNNIKDTAHKHEKIGKTGVKLDRRCWTLDDLKNRQIYLIGAGLSNPRASERESWIDAHYSKIEGFEAKTLHLKFTYLVQNAEPNRRTIINNLLEIVKWTKRTFKMHWSYFIKKNSIKKAIVNVEVDIDIIFLNKIALKNADTDDLLDWFERKMRRKATQAEYKYRFNIDFKEFNINPHNEHLKAKDKNKDDDEQEQEDPAE